MTEKQKATLEYIKRFISQHDRFPKNREVQEWFEWKSTNSVFSVLQALVKKGYLVRNKGYRLATCCPGCGREVAA